jgi:Ca-activated chloride channel homolog
MAKKLFLFLWILSGLLLARGSWTTAQENSGSRIFVNVVLVQLNVAVTDHKGN